MKYRLVWTDESLAELTKIYTDTLASEGNGASITKASARIDRTLTVNPADVGESRDGNERVTFEVPLTVYFDVHEDEQVVFCYFRPSFPHALNKRSGKSPSQTKTKTTSRE